MILLLIGAGNYKHLRSFARRRKWIRLRRRRVVDDDQSYHSNDAVSIHTASILENESTAQDAETKEDALFDRLKSCRLDRERLKIVDESLQENDTQLDMIQAKVKIVPELQCMLEARTDAYWNKRNLSYLTQMNEYMRLFDFEESRRKFVVSARIARIDQLTFGANFPAAFAE